MKPSPVSHLKRLKIAVPKASAPGYTNPMSDILEKIKAYTLDHITACKAAFAIGMMEDRAKSASPVRGFASALKAAEAAGGYGLIAEIKKASPSKGLIREDFNPPALAKAYEDGGAACLSVLTDTPSFQGKPEYLVEARNAVSIPVLRKDFMVDPYQMATARAWGADCILLIMACLEDTQAQELAAAAKSWGMDILVEVHDAVELERALDIDTPLIGINNRNLKTFETALETTELLAPGIHKSKIIISESGIRTHDDLLQLENVGACCFLVGECLMRHEDVTKATKDLLGL